MSEALSAWSGAGRRTTNTVRSVAPTMTSAGDAAMRWAPLKNMNCSPVSLL